MKLAIKKNNRFVPNYVTIKIRDSKAEIISSKINTDVLLNKSN